MADYTKFTDDELVTLLMQGDMHAFNQIYHRYFDSMYKFAFRILNDEDDCNDMLQNIFIWLWEHREKLRINSLSSYLFAAIKFNLVGVIKRSNRRTEILTNVPTTQMEFEDLSLELKELTQIIKNFTETLPNKAREIFELSRSQYLNNKEIATLMGLSEKTVENQMTISLKKLKNHLGKNSFWSFLI